MQLRLGKNRSNDLKIYKNVIWEDSIDFKFKDDTDLQNPIIIITNPHVNIEFNYCAIISDNFSKEYFITNRILLANNLLELHLKEDVLTTFTDVIEEGKGIIERNTRDDYNSDDKGIIDIKYSLSNKKIIVEKDESFNTIDTMYSDTLYPNYYLNSNLEWVSQNGVVYKHYDIPTSVNTIKITYKKDDSTIPLDVNSNDILFEISGIGEPTTGIKVRYQSTNIKNIYDSTKDVTRVISLPRKGMPTIYGTTTQYLPIQGIWVLGNNTIVERFNNCCDFSSSIVKEDNNVSVIAQFDSSNSEYLTDYNNDIPSLNIINGCQQHKSDYSGIYRAIALNDIGKNTLTTLIKDDNARASYVLNMISYPFTLSVDTLNDSGWIHFPNDSQGVTHTLPYKDIPTKSYIYQNACFKFALPTDRPKFTYQTPYTTYEIFLPYVGWIPLNSSECIDKWIRVYYVIDFTQTTGSCIVTSSDGTDTNPENEKIIYNTECEIGTSIMISTSNKLEINDLKTSNILNTIVGAINPLSLPNQITRNLTTELTTHEEVKTSRTTSNSGTYTYQKVRSRLTYYDKIINYNDFNELYGIPLNQYSVNIGNDVNDGYLQVDNFIISESLNTTINYSELTELKMLLKNGVYY